jgi:cyclic pyranopterin phosphate synthase
LKAFKHLFTNQVNYLRISVTDRCNQRCFYCMPDEGLALFEPRQILSYEEILAVVRAAAHCGFSKFRLTGGEPLIRREVCTLIARMADMDHVREVTLTTNGVLLAELAADLLQAGLNRLNISLDTLNPVKFQKITGRNYFARVMRGIEQAQAVGFSPVKINVVVIRGVNDDELEAFARWSMETALVVRFIEYMPIGRNNGWDQTKFISSEEIRNRLSKVAALRPLPSSKADGPAQRFALGSTPGEIGLIGALSNHFCHTCNRLRLTPDGKLRPCLMSDREIDLAPCLRSGSAEQELIRLLKAAVMAKPMASEDRRLTRSGCSRAMSRMGG